MCPKPRRCSSTCPQDRLPMTRRTQYSAPRHRAILASRNGRMEARVDLLSPRLERHRIFFSRDLDEAHGFLARKNFVADFPGRDDASLDMHLNGIYLPGMYVGYFCYGRAVTIRATPARTDYWFQFPTERQFEIKIGNQQLLCDANHGAVLSPTHENVIRSEHGCGRMALSLTRDALVRQLTALLGRPLGAPLEFAPSMNLASGYGQSMTRYVRTAVDDFEQNDSLLRNPLALASFEQFLITALLLSHPHNYWEELRKPAPPIAPRDVRRVVDYIESNLSAPITIADLVGVSGVSGRALFKHFRKYLRSSPMLYLRDARFRRIREVLQNATPDDRIANVAARYGFDHCGRFGIEYHRRFGEKPSDTKRRACSRSV